MLAEEAIVSWMDELRARAKAARYAAVKGTPAHEAEQEDARAAAVERIVELGYTRQRAERAVRDYADAARDTLLGPRWDHWLGVLEEVPLVAPGPVTGHAAELVARKRRGSARR